MDDSVEPTPSTSPRDPTVSRRRLLTWAGRAGLGLTGGGLAAGGLMAGCVSGKSSRKVSPPLAAKGGSTTGLVGPRPIRIGYIAEITGPNSDRGVMVKAGFDAMTGYLGDKLGGAYLGYKPEFLPADAAATAADARAAYQQLLTQKVDAVVWCVRFGLAELMADIGRGGVPVISVFADLFSYANNRVPVTGSGATGMSVFQLALPDAYAIDVMMAYAREDRGFSTAGLLFDKSVYPGVDDHFTAAVTKHGITPRKIAGFDPTAGSISLIEPIQAMKESGCQVVVCYGQVDQVSSILTDLQTLDGSYVDTPTARQSKFKPMVMGSTWGTGAADLVGLAGDAARRGTISVSSLGSVPTLPTLPMRRWIHDYLPDYHGGVLQGGEDGPADAAAAIIAAADRAGSTKSADLIKALESGVVTKFASSAGYSFAPDRHLAVSRDDVALLTLEFPGEPFNLGTEWKEILKKDYQGMTHLVDYTLGGNTRAHPDVVVEILERLYGTSSGDDYQGGDPAKVAAARALH